MAVTGKFGGKALFEALRDAVDDTLIAYQRNKLPLVAGADFRLQSGSFLGNITSSPFLMDRVKTLRPGSSPALPSGLVAVIGKGGSGKTTFLQNCHSNYRAAKQYRFSGEPVIVATQPAHLSLSWLAADLLSLVLPKHPALPPDPVTGGDYVPSIAPGDVVYVDSLTDLINYTSLGATTGGYGRDLGELYHALQWACYLTGVMIVGTVNPYTSNDDHFQFVFGSLENRVMMTVVLGEIESAPLSSYPLFGGSTTGKPVVSGTRIARVYLRDVARGNNALNVEI